MALPQTLIKTNSNVAVTSPLFVVPPPSLLSGLKVWSFFGTDGPGQAGNVAAGGVAFTATGTGPSYFSNYAAVMPGNTLGGLDTNIVWNSALIASGFSAVWVVEMPATGSPATVFCNGTAAKFGINMQNNNLSDGNVPEIGAIFAGAAPSSGAGTLFTTPVQNIWKTWGLSWAGTGTVVNLYDLTDGTSYATPAYSPGTSTDTLKIGNYSGGGAWGNTFNLAHFALWDLPISGANLATLRTSIASLVAFRGIAGA